MIYRILSSFDGFLKISFFNKYLIKHKSSEGYIMPVVKFRTLDEAKELGFDNRGSGLNARTVQQTIDMLYQTKESADSNILKTSNIGVNVQGYDAGTVIDSSYVHTDNNFTTTYKEILDTSIAVKNIFRGTISATSGTSIITPGTPEPNSTNGTQLWSQEITPQSGSSKIVIRCSLTIAGSSSGSAITAAVFRNTTYIGSSIVCCDTKNDYDGVVLEIFDIPNTTELVTYSCRIGTSSGTWYVNRRNSEITYGGTKTGWTITEF